MEDRGDKKNRGRPREAEELEADRNEIPERKASQRELFALVTIFVSIQKLFREAIVEITRAARVET